MQNIIINNCLVSYNISGQNSAAGSQCLLFLHGWRSNKEVWGSVVHQVVKSSSYQVYTLDLPGFGASQIPKQVWGVGDYAEIVKGFIEKLDLKNITIVGHSFGGRVGIKLAAKYPVLISKLVLVDSAGFAMDSSRKNLIGTAAKIVKPFFKLKFMQGLRAKIYKTIGAEDYLATPELQQTFVKVTQEDLSEDMKKIICPTLIITGENDMDTPVEFGQRMNFLILNSKFSILKNAGHFSFIDKPQEFASQLFDFIS